MEFHAVPLPVDEDVGGRRLGSHDELTLGCFGDLHRGEQMGRHAGSFDA